MRRVQRRSGGSATSSRSAGCSPSSCGSSRGRRPRRRSCAATTREYLERIKALSAENGGDAGELTPFGPGRLRDRAPRSGRRHHRHRRRPRRHGRQRLRAHPPARPPRRAGPRARLLHLRERRDRREARARGARARARRRRRLGRPPRQRHPEDLLGGPERSDDLESPGQQLSARLGSPPRGRRRRGEGYNRQHPAAAGLGRRRVRRRVRASRRACAARFQAGADHRRVGARRQHAWIRSRE